jgi:hypothetical protein
MIDSRKCCLGGWKIVDLKKKEKNDFQKYIGHWRKEKNGTNESW